VTSLTLSQRIKAERDRRRNAADSLIGFTTYTLPKYRAADHHLRLAAGLEAVESGEIDRLMVTMPPRHGKSELVSRRFPAWFLGRNPEAAIIAASYNAELAADFGRKVREIIQSDAARRVFRDLDLRGDNKAADRFGTTEGGEYFAVGVGGATTGRGADVFLIDDPVKNREDADSEAKRRAAKDWYRSTAYTRLMPGGRIVMVLTRWNEGDLAGWQLEEMAAGGDQWHRIDMPAINSAGEPLWPQRYPLPALERIRRAVGPRDWSALYQQRPAPETGDYFRREWLRPVAKMPPKESLRIYGASDYAVTSDGGDFTVHVVLGMDADGRLWLLDLWRRQAASDVWIEAFCDLAKQWRPLGWAEETGQIKAGVGPFLDRRQRERGAYVARTQFPTRGDKAVRAQSIRGRMALEGLHIPAGAPWRADFEAEMMSFPAGKHDDQVDALGLVGQLLDRMVKAATPPGDRPPPDRYAQKRPGGSWKTV